MKIEFTPEDFEQIRLIIREELAANKPVKEDPKFYTRDEACELLKITLPTLHAWKCKGIIHQTKIQNRVLISESEIKRIIEGRKLS
jgi:hypothetical protein